MQRLLDRIDAPAYIRNGRMDILATNKLGEALYSEILANPRRPANTARFCFLDPRAATFFVDWDETADASVAVLRAEAGRNPHDQDLTNLIGELSTQSEDFRVRWARHDVGTHDAGVKRLHHPLVGRLELTYEGMTLAADPDLVMFAFTAEIGSKSERGAEPARKLGSHREPADRRGHERPLLRRDRGCFAPGSAADATASLSSRWFQSRSRRAKVEKRRCFQRLPGSPLPDSNRRPPPYHGGALPTELRGQRP